MPNMNWLDHLVVYSEAFKGVIISTFLWSHLINNSCRKYWFWQETNKWTPFKDNVHDVLVVLNIKCTRSEKRVRAFMHNACIQTFWQSIIAWQGDFLCFYIMPLTIILQVGMNFLWFVIYCFQVKYLNNDKIIWFSSI